MNNLDNIVVQYWKEFGELKQEHQDLDNLSFNAEWGLAINPPTSWFVYDAACRLVEEAVCDGARNVVVIYPSSKAYRQVAGVLEESVESASLEIEYWPWQAIYVAMDRVNDDARQLKHYRTVLGNADLTILLGASSVLPDVAAQVSSSCNGCFVRLG